MVDPLADYANGVKIVIEDLNRNIEIVKNWMRIQNTHNELFIEHMSKCNERLLILEEKFEKFHDQEGYRESVERIFFLSEERRFELATNEFMDFINNTSQKPKDILVFSKKLTEKYKI